MVFPIVIGIGITVAALSTKAILKTVTRYNRLTPSMIATLNKLRLEPRETTTVSDHNGQASHIRYLRSRFDATGFEHNMTEQEALLVLGIEAGDIAGLTKENLRQRYRKLMVMNHPDRQGSVYMSQKINQAKEILEKSYMFRK